MENSSSAYDWIHEIKPEIKKLDSIPLTGACPPFPWEDLSARLASTFQIDSIQLKPGETAWRAKETLFEGLGDSPLALSFSVPTLQGQVCWVISKQAMGILAALVLTDDAHPIHMDDSSLIESFSRCIAIEVLYNLMQIPYEKSLVPVMNRQSPLPNEDSLCRDIAIHLLGQIIWSRLIISPDLRLSWVEHFEQKPQTTELSQELSQNVDVEVLLEAGKTFLTLEEWESVQLGDCLLLDKCLLDPNSLEGPIHLTVSGKRAFRAQLEKGSITILELPTLTR